MHIQAPLIVSKDQDIDQALEAIGLTRDIVQKVALAAAAARADTLVIDPTNAAGTLAYIHGIRAIRMNLLRLSGWRISRAGNIEATVNDESGIQVCFQNVDSACDARKTPRAISDKGAAARGLVAAGQGELFPGAGNEKRPRVFGGTPTVWLICVAVDGFSVRAEVSCPTSFEGNHFEDFHKRIFVLDQKLAPTIRRVDSPDDDFDEMDVHISKK